MPCGAQGLLDTKPEAIIHETTALADGYRGGRLRSWQMAN
jgi:hypothetical protein